MKKFKRVGIGVVLVVVLSVLLAGFYLYSKTPERDGVLAIGGLKSRVEVIYDDFGVPHIYARNDEDMYRAFGYVHAQDRLFQMDLLRRLGQGRLAELFGEDVVNVDRLFRTVQVSRFSKQWMAAYSKSGPKKILRALDAYLGGINHFIAEGPTPVEFEILGVEKSAFTRDDIAAVVAYTAFSFTFGLSQDLLVSNLIEALDDEYIEDLGIRWQPGSARIPVNRKGIERFSQELSSVIRQIGPTGIFQGSNGWAVAPERSRSGKAMLVNDPHMGFSQPSVWYEAHLVSPESEIYGHHLALVPFAFLGNNRDLAWGLTMFVNDDIDLFKETINPADSNQYWAVDRWRSFDQYEDVIKVKGAQDIVLNLTSSRHGPIISDAFSGFDNSENLFLNTEDKLAMWWVFFDEENDLMGALYDLTRAKNVQQAERAVKKIHSPGLNVMYADRHGDIAWWAAAKLVKRPAHVNSSTILDGASGRDDPLGFYDFSSNPQILNPASGALYTANNQPADTGIGLIPGYYVPRDRAERIEEYLFSDEMQWDADKMKSMLLDNTSPLVSRFQEVIVPILANSTTADNSELSREALRIFESWQGNHDPEEVAVTLFYRFKQQLLRQTFKDEMGEHNFDNFEGGFLRHKTLWKMLANERSPWWDNITTDDAQETQADIISSSWMAMLQALQSEYGSDIKTWKWGDSLQLEHAHPLGSAKPLDLLFNVGPLQVAGGNETINNMIFSISDEAFKATWGPSTRRIVDFGNIEESWGINPTGQSGVILDRHYSDQSEMFAKGVFRRQYTSREDVLAHKEGVLALHPE